MPSGKLTRRGVIRQVRQWQKRLGLELWTILINFETPSGDEDASCSAQPEYQYAVLYFDLDRINPSMMERYIIHELAHCLVWRLANVATALAQGDTSKLEWVRTEEETLTTQLEVLLLGLAPD